MTDEQKLQDFMSNYLKQYPNASANEIEREAKKAGINTGITFKDFVDKLNRFKERNQGLLGSLGSLFGIGEQETAASDDSNIPTEKKMKVLWMPAAIGIPVAIVGLGLIGFGIYKLATKNKK